MLTKPYKLEESQIIDTIEFTFEVPMCTLLVIEPPSKSLPGVLGKTTAGKSDEMEIEIPKGCRA
jgi:hypothetical protein